MNKIKSVTTISIILIFSIIIGLISNILIKANATENIKRPELGIELNQVTVNGQVTTDYNVNVNDEIEFKYKVTPGDIVVSDVNIPTQKEVVLVLDTSGSMSRDFSGNTTNIEQNQKIYALKNAAKSFIDKCTGNNNIKIGIVPYSYYSGYKNEIKELMTVATSNDASSLRQYIDSIKPDGATNHGDGLRVAGSMLTDSNSNSAAQKYLIFLTDGEPTGITFTNDNLGAVPDLNIWATDQYGNKDKNVYTFMDGNNYTTNGYKYDYSTTPNRIDNRYNYGWYGFQHNYYDINLEQEFSQENNLKYIDFNNTVLDNIPTKYAEVIGQKLKNDISNFHESTIAYGTSVVSDGKSSISKVNESMGGNLYSAKDSNTIENIFKGLADEIVQEYTIDNVNFNLKLSELLEFTPDEIKFNLEGNYQVAPIDNIKYKLNSDKTKYIADPFYISFKVKAKAVGIVNVGELSNISYKNINGDIVNKEMPITKINIIDNNLPYINAHLISPIPNTISYPSQPIDVKYQIDTEQFEYNLQSNVPIDEAVFVVDETKKMSDSQRYTNFKNGFDNRILDGTILGEKDIKINAVGYNDYVNFPNSDYYNSLIGRKSEREKLRLAFEDHIKMSESSNNRNIEGALDKANSLLQEKGEQGKNKAIIIVSSGDANYNIDSNVIKTISKNGYRIISLDLSNTDGSENANLKKLHQLLSGNNDDYILAKADGGNYNTPEINYAEGIAKRLAGEGGTSSTVNTISIKNVKLNFDLGENFDAVSGLDGTGKIRTVTIPEIKYTLKQDEASGKYLWQQDPQSIEVNFKIQPVDGKRGKLEFASDSQGDLSENLKNYISYVGLNKKEIKKHIETPVINLIDDVVPRIDANVVNPPSEAMLFKEIPLEYEIKPQKFNQDSIAKNIVFALDISKTTGNGQPFKDEPQKIAEVKKAIDNNLKNSKIKNASYGALTYSGKGVLENLPLRNDLYPISEKLHAAVEDAAGHINTGENAAVQQFKNDYSQKYVVIISSGFSNNWKFTTGLYTNSIVDNQTIGTYKKIILDLSYVKNLSEIGGDIQNIFNQIANAKSPASYPISTKLKFHINNEKFSVISGLEKSSDQWYGFETQAFPVNYILQNNGDYVSEKVPNIRFSIKAKVTGSLKFGDIELENPLDNKYPGAVSYASLVNKQVFNRIAPFNININQNIKHGLYQNVDSGELAVIQPSAELIRGVIGNLAVGCDIASSNADIKLQINNKVDITSVTNPIKIYKIINNQLVEIIGASYIKQGSNGEYNNYAISLPSGINSETKVVIMYQCKIPEGNIMGPFLNKAFVNGTEADFTLNASSNTKPELF